MATITVTHECMPEHDAAPPGNRDAKTLLALILTFVPLLGVGLVIRTLLIPIALCVPVILGVALALIVRLGRIGNSTLPPLLAVTGIFFIAGGTAFDMAATVLHSPSLSAEGNLVALAFLDAGYSLSFVYTFAILAQGLFVIFLSIAWLAFLKHRDHIVASIGRPNTFRELVRGAIGGAHLPKRRWWSLTIRLSELPRAYNVAWFMVVLLVAGMLDSWYLGLEWFNVVRSIRWFVVTLAIVSGMACYFCWLWRASRRNNDGI